MMLAGETASVFPVLVSGTNIIVAWCGTNDFATTSASQSWTNLAAYANAIRARGVKAKLIVVTMMSANGRDTFKNQLNPLIRTNWPGVFDAIADVAADIHLGSDGAYASTTYFVDGLHPTLLSSQTLIAPIIQTAINLLL